MKNLISRAGLMAALIVGPLCAGASAADYTIAREDFSGTSLRFALQREVSNITLVVAGPGGYRASKFVKSGPPQMNLARHGKVRDGRYSYEMSAALENEFVDEDDQLDNGRGAGARKRANKPAYQYGAFHVVDGEITPMENLIETEGHDSDQ